MEAPPANCHGAEATVAVPRSPGLRVLEWHCTVARFGVGVLVLVAALDAKLGRAVDAVALRMVRSDQHDG